MSAPRVMPEAIVPTANLSVFVSRKVTPPPAVTVAWDASTDPTVTGYNVYQGASSGVYTVVSNALNATSITFSNLAFGSLNYFAATAYNNAGMESDYSAQAVYQAPSLPLPPGNFRISASFASALPGPWLQDTNWPPVVVNNPLGNMLWRLDAERVSP